MWVFEGRDTQRIALQALEKESDFPQFATGSHLGQMSHFFIEFPTGSYVYRDVHSRRKST